MEIIETYYKASVYSPNDGYIDVEVTNFKRGNFDLSKPLYCVVHRHNNTAHLFPTEYQHDENEMFRCGFYKVKSFRKVEVLERETELLPKNNKQSESQDNKMETVSECLGREARNADKVFLEAIKRETEKLIDDAISQIDDKYKEYEPYRDGRVTCAASRAATRNERAARSDGFLSGLFTAKMILEKIKKEHTINNKE